jgi:Uma2 family endonuclease
MGLPLKAIATFTPAEYLALEAASSNKHEFLDGVIYAWQGQVPEAMAGGSKRHNKITLNIAAALRRQLAGTGCDVYATDVRLRVSARDAYFYPDIIVTCAERDRGEGMAVEEPTLLIEVSSESTAEFDRREKFEVCKLLPSLQAYVIVSGSGRQIEVFSRQAAWERTADAREGQARLPGLDLSLAVDEVYAGTG